MANGVYASGSLTESQFSARMSELLNVVAKSSDLAPESVFKAAKELVRSATLKRVKGRIEKADRILREGAAAADDDQEAQAEARAAEADARGSFERAMKEKQKSQKARMGSKSRRLLVPHSDSARRKFDLELTELTSALSSVLGPSESARRTLHVGDSCSLPMPEDPSEPLHVSVPVRTRAPLSIHFTAPKHGDSVFTLCASFANNTPSPESSGSWSVRALQTACLFLLEDDPRYVPNSVLNIAVSSNGASNAVVQLRVAAIQYTALVPGRHVRLQLTPESPSRTYRIKFADSKTGAGACSFVVEHMTLRGETECFISHDPAHAVPSAGARLWFLGGSSTRLQVDPPMPLYKNNCAWYISVALKDPHATAVFALRAYWQPYPPKSYQQLTSSLANVIAEEDERARLTGTGRHLSLAEAHFVAAGRRLPGPTANQEGSQAPPSVAAEGEGEEAAWRVPVPGVTLPPARGAASLIAKDPFLSSVAARHDLARHTARSQRLPWEPARMAKSAAAVHHERLAVERASRRASLSELGRTLEEGVAIHELPVPDKPPSSDPAAAARTLVASKLRAEAERVSPRKSLPSPHSAAVPLALLQTPERPTPPRVHKPRGLPGRPGRSPYDQAPHTVR